MLSLGYSQKLSDLFVVWWIHAILARKVKFKIGSKKSCRFEVLLILGAVCSAGDERIRSGGTK